MLKNMRSFHIKKTLGQGDPEHLDGDFRSLLEKGPSFLDSK